MPEANKPETKTEAKAEATGRSAAECARLVQRVVVSTKTIAAKDGQPAKEERTETRVAVKADEVLAHKDYGTHVVVATRDGQKLDSREAVVGVAAAKA